MREDITSLRRQLDHAEQNLRIIQDRKAEYVLAEDIPLQLIKEEQALEARIAQITTQMGAEPVAVPPHMNNNAADLRAEVARLQAEVHRLQQEKEELRVAVAGPVDGAQEPFGHAMVDVLRHASALARMLDRQYGRVSDRARGLTRAIEHALTSTHDTASIRALTQAYDIANIIADMRIGTREMIAGIAIVILTLITIIVIFFTNIINNSYVRLAFVFIIPTIIFSILKAIVVRPHSRADTLFKIILGIADTELGAVHPEVIAFEQTVEAWKQRVRQSKEQE